MKKQCSYKQAYYSLSDMNQCVTTRKNDNVALTLEWAFNDSVIIRNNGVPFMRITLNTFADGVLVYGGLSQVSDKFFDSLTFADGAEVMRMCSELQKTEKKIVYSLQEKLSCEGPDFVIQEIAKLRAKQVKEITGLTDLTDRCKWYESIIENATQAFYNKCFDEAFFSVSGAPNGITKPNHATLIALIRDEMRRLLTPFISCYEE